MSPDWEARGGMWMQEVDPHGTLLTEIGLSMFSCNHSLGLAEGLFAKGLPQGAVQAQTLQACTTIITLGKVKYVVFSPQMCQSVGLPLQFFVFVG